MCCFRKKTRGVTILLVVAFTGVFAIVTSALFGFIFTQAQTGRAKAARESAFQIAEAGLNYYRWFLAHNPDDLQDGTGEAGPYVHAYEDPETGVIGSFSLSVSGNTACEVVQSVDITAVGTADADTRFSRTVSARYARPSVAEFSYIINSNVWAGSTREIRGPYHSNGGIRMDGENNSTVTSAVESWLCTASFGCSPDSTENGVFGSGDIAALWEFPVPQIDFAGLTVDLATMKTHAQTTGLYFPSISGGSNRYGYHLIFKNDSTIDVYQVTSTAYNWGYTSAGGWQRDYHRIIEETFLGNYVIPASCSVVFIEDTVWLEGTVSGKVTLAAADFVNPGYSPDIIIHDDVDYSITTGADGLTAIAENSIAIAVDSPDVLEMRGIYIAQNGHFGRNYYTYGNPSYAYDTFERDTLEIVGTIVSNGRVGTSWSCGGSFCSGYANRETSYDRPLASDPPPFTPYTSVDYQFVRWREQ